MRFSIHSFICAFGVLSVFISQISICLAGKKYNRYLAHIFTKYGSGGTMSFEGLEHLMYNLGLGEIEFNPTHTIDEHRPNGYKFPDLLDLPDYEDDQNKEANISPTTVRSSLTLAETETVMTNIIAPNELSGEVIAALKNDQNLIDNDSALFKEMHDPKHRHRRHRDRKFTDQSSNVCLSPQSVLKLVIDHDDIHMRNRQLYRMAGTVPGLHESQSPHDIDEEYNTFINTMKITPLAFMKLCPALLAQLDQDVCIQPAPKEELHVAGDNLLNAWIYASVSIFILSSCGVLGIALVPLMKTIAYQEILKFLVAIAVGTLCGDALMHLLPHALSHVHSATKDGEKHDHNGPVWIMACAFLTAVFMYIVETILPMFRDPGDGHNHSHSSPKQIATESKEINTMLDDVKEDKKTGSRPLTPVAFMVIIGDALHNLTDGLAIGAAFASDPVTGMATAFAVLCHELPHELGDFALLLQTGVSIRRAVCLNIVSSVLSFMGMAIGLLVAGVHGDMVQWIYAGTAGSFLYISLADLIPAMSMEGRNNLKNSVIQVTGILVGGIIMLFIAINEDELRLLFE